MTVNTNRNDMANASIEISCKAEDYDKFFTQVAKETSKNMNISGFRKGKVPIKLVKQRYAKELENDTENKIMIEAFEKGLKDMGLSKKDVISQPSFSNYNKKNDNSITATMKISLTPIFVLEDYKALLPEIKTKKITAKAVEDRLNSMAHEKAPMKNIEDRAVQNDDYVTIDFAGYIDGELFEGGKSSGHLLHIGSKQFIGNFEDQLIGAKIGDSKEVNVTFPDDYAKEELKGKQAKFDVKIHSIQVKAKSKLTDKIIKEIFPDDADITLESAKEKIKKELKTAKYQEHFFDDLKPIFIKNLLEKHTFPLPELVVEKELELLLNDKVAKFSKEDLDKLKDNKEEQDKLKDNNRKEAEERVKATFIINEIAKKERIEINDNEVMQRVYLQALYAGQNPDEYIKKYEESNMLPGVKMMLIEESVINMLFTKKLEEGK
jgi:trigger factor